VRLEKGVQLVMYSSGIMDKLQHADIVITGEGKIDKQTAFGKVVSEVALAAAQHHIPVVAFCGVSEVDDGGPLHLNAIRAITPQGMPREESMAKAKVLLKNSVADYFECPENRFLKKM